MDIKNEPIHIILTGGRIDSVWDGKQDTIIVSPESVIPEYFKTFYLYDQLIFTQVCMKDSRALTKEDREAMLKAIEESNSTKIIITHGTDTMLDSIKFLKENLKRTDQTIVFTGSITPLKDFDFSDAPFNLGYALYAAQNLPTGAYLCMNGRHFTLEEIEEYRKSGKFFSFFANKQ